MANMRSFRFDLGLVPVFEQSWEMENCSIKKRVRNRKGSFKEIFVILRMGLAFIVVSLHSANSKPPRSQQPA